jgi:hypothetical protein
MGNSITPNDVGIIQTAHGIFLTILWAGFADAFLIIAKFYKHWQYYLWFHSLFGILNVIGIAMILLPLILRSKYLFSHDGFSSMGGPPQAHFLMGMIFLFCTTGIQILGMVAKINI